MADILDFKTAEFGPDLACVTNFLKCPYHPLSQNEGTFQCTLLDYGLKGICLTFLTPVIVCGCTLTVHSCFGHYNRPCLLTYCCRALTI